MGQARNDLGSRWQMTRFVLASNAYAGHQLTFILVAFFQEKMCNEEGKFCMSYVQNLRKCVGTQPLILPGASVIIVSDEKILFQYRSDTHNWGLPGGLMEPDESLENCARREVHEETGLLLGNLELLSVFSGPEYYYRYPHGDEIYNVTAAYVSRDILRGDMVKQADEVLELRFFDLSELPTNILQPEQPIVDQYILYHNKELY